MDSVTSAINITYPIFIADRSYINTTPTGGGHVSEATLHIHYRKDVITLEYSTR